MSDNPTLLLSSKELCSHVSALLNIDKRAPVGMAVGKGLSTSVYIAPPSRTLQGAQPPILSLWFLSSLL